MNGCPSAVIHFLYPAGGPAGGSKACCIPAELRDCEKEYFVRTAVRRFSDPARDRAVLLREGERCCPAFSGPDRFMSMQHNGGNIICC